ncbi:retinol-binding protein pinta-like [Amphibalanus amphitrite]|uniref:retinol-binding protein pinta-like n=1 Tax=Amphibalanus amphitrite TaxID=1232801 RepID=UPI001C926D22|nr:retinol-binding protein pinta-like [Amphibalanus amphitrite]
MTTPLLARRSQPYQCSLPEPILAQAQRELFEVPDRRQTDIEHLRQWLCKQPHLRTRTDDWFLINFLRGAKFSLERAKEKLELYHSLKTHCPEMMGGGDPKDDMVAEVLRAGGFVPTPKPLPNGQRLVIIRVAARDTERVPQEVMFRVSNMISALLAEQDEASQVTGIVGLLDLKDATLAHAMSMTPTLVKKAVTCWDSFPVRQKGMHYFNTPTGMDPVINLFRSFMKEKMKQRLWFHGSDQSSLHSAIPPECLPEEYGGTLPSVNALAEEWVKRVEENREFFLDYMKYGVDEKLRRGKAKSAADLFDIEGSFRKLEID